jgi:hypothetical protein
MLERLSLTNNAAKFPQKWYSALGPQLQRHLRCHRNFDLAARQDANCDISRSLFIFFNYYFLFNTNL